MNHRKGAIPSPGSLAVWGLPFARDGIFMTPRGAVAQCLQLSCRPHTLILGQLTVTTVGLITKACTPGKEAKGWCWVLPAIDFLPSTCFFPLSVQGQPQQTGGLGIAQGEGGPCSCPNKAAGSELWEQDGLHQVVLMPPRGQQPSVKWTWPQGQSIRPLVSGGRQ